MHKDFMRLAERYNVSVDAVYNLAEALQCGEGRMAQFNHRDLGGAGQWMPGMVMVGDVFNNQLKTKVNALCENLLRVLSETPTRPMEPITPPGFEWGNYDDGRRWWPEQLGRPDASGGQNRVKFAFFRAKNRLLVNQNGHFLAYDTSGYLVNGVSQRQRNGIEEIKLSTTSGIIDVNILKIVELDT